MKGNFTFNYSLPIPCYSKIIGTDAGTLECPSSAFPTPTVCTQKEILPDLISDGNNNTPH